MFTGFVSFCLVSSALSQSAEAAHQIPLIEVEVGKNVTLQCPVTEKEGKFVHWFKQSPGYIIQTVATGSYTKQTLSEEFNNGRFTVSEGQSLYFLSMRNVQKEDEATYSCQYGSAYSQTFNTSVYLQRAVYVKQTPEAVSVHPGSSVTLQCSLFSNNNENRSECPDEHRVYWFRAGSGQSHATIIYTHRNYSQKQEGRRCVHSLSKTIQSSSDAGIYYCAVVTCAEIVFGEGTQRNNFFLLSSIICCLIIITASYLVNFICHSQFKCFLQPESDAVNYVALNFSSRNRVKKNKMKESPQECVYSAVRPYNHASSQTS
uniref:Ig-like domain-containing protein n=1 Tax=Neolamprologus brichardi TaxID=32507 RepID=A0A3Q4HMF0_NEOBR